MLPLLTHCGTTVSEAPTASMSTASTEEISADTTATETPSPDLPANEADVTEDDTPISGKKLYIHIGDTVLPATLADNSSCDALLALLADGDVTVDMHDFSNFEKVGELPTELPRNDEDITTGPGDLILYLGKRFVIYYDINTWDFTRIGWLDGEWTTDGLLEILGDGDVIAVLSSAG